jgi:hypothetical protein
LRRRSEERWRRERVYGDEERREQEMVRLMFSSKHQTFDNYRGMEEEEEEEAARN